VVVVISRQIGSKIKVRERGRGHREEDRFF